MQFDSAACDTVALGKGIMISHEEALEILHQAQMAGLVLQPANSRNPIFLCACCNCCGGVLRTIKKSPNPNNQVVNPYVNRHDPRRCTNCCAYLKVCPMDALYRPDEKVEFNPERCIGCGLCVTVCKQHAIKMVLKPEARNISIPSSTLDTYTRMGLRSGRWNYLGMLLMVMRSQWQWLIAPL